MKEEFKPFDRVLVRHGSGLIWKCALFSHMEPSLSPEYKKDLYFTTCGYERQCIPFEGNEHLAGTANEPAKPKLKVIRGDKTRYSEVIKLLENMGGKNTMNLRGDIADDYYHVDKSGVIVNHSQNSPFFNVYELEILALPVKKPKLQVIRGDEERGDKVIAMLKKLGGSILTNLKGVYEEWYYYVNEEGLIDSRNISSKFFDNYELEILELLPEKKRWRAKNEFIYYYVDSDFQVVNDRDFRDVLDNGRYECGNYFKTKEEAEVVAKKIKNILKVDE